MQDNRTEASANEEGHGFVLQFRRQPCNLSVVRHLLMQYWLPAEYMSPNTLAGTSRLLNFAIVDGRRFKSSPKP